MAKVGLFFGSFNPIHIGHIILANHMTEATDLDEVWLVITPQSPFKQKQSMLANNHRYALVDRAIENYPKLKISTIEFDLPTPNYTSDTLVHIEEKYPQHRFALIMGKDNLVSFHKWKNYTVLLERYALYIYPRKESKPIPAALENHKNIIFTDAPEINITASHIRRWIKDGKNVRALVPPNAWEYLDEMNFYRNT